MFKSLARTIRGPSRDPRMEYISRPLPRDLPDEQVVEALELALAENRDPAFLVETLPDALRRVTGRSYQVLDRSVRDVTGRYHKVFVMIRDGDVGRWRGYEAMSYPLLAPSDKARETLAALEEADAQEESLSTRIGQRWRVALGSGAAPPLERPEGAEPLGEP